MRFGVCTGSENLERVKDTGSAYIECSVTGLCSLSDAELDSFAERLSRNELRCEALNVLFPGDLQLIGSEADCGKIREYLDKAFRRVSVVKPEIVVFGSGRARMRPDTGSPEDAFAQLIDIGRMIAAAAEPYGITIALEPLNTTETNTINSLAEGADLVRAVGCGNFRLLADMYHMLMEDEPAEEIAKCKGLIVHTHTAIKEGRRCPGRTDAGTLAPYFAALRDIGYDGRMSVEGNISDMEHELPEAFNLFEELAL